ALVGAFGDDISVTGNEGSAYIFTRSGSVWTQQMQLTASDGEVNDYFGVSVALSGDGKDALIGAYGDDIGANVSQGSAYIIPLP
ncbi:MAG: FG-GAP repeat protein, partial [Armatimonadetes bacterium]|nr:FG-GAP repeat protein [Anaerolineae bacterium]